MCLNLEFLDRIKFAKFINRSKCRQLEGIRKKNESTLKWLRKKQHGFVEPEHSCIVNLAGIELADIEKEVLCRGLKYGIPPKVRREEVEAEFELCYQQLQQLPVQPGEDKIQTCKTKLAGIAEDFASTKIDKTGFPLNTGHLKTINELRRRKDIVITRPDKGDGVIIMSSKQYTDKMLDILAQDSKFEEIGDAAEKDRTIQHERALQAYLLRAHKDKFLDKDTYERIRPVGTATPRMYGVPKLHKEGTPLRPILSMINSPQHELAKWLADILKPVVKKFSKHTVKDSYEFCQDLDDFVNSDDGGYFMCSFDVKSLFTNVPLKETIEICLDSLYRDDEIPTPKMPEPKFQKLLLKATSGVDFFFQQKIYRQNDGVAMGSPLGPVLANIFVGFCETLIPDHLWPRFYKRYVDDTFSLFTNEEESMAFFQAPDCVHCDLQFTME